jgi:hypothetical protein
MGMPASNKSVARICPFFDVCFLRHGDYFRMMTPSLLPPRLSIAAAVLMASSLSAAAQMPIAGSGGLPPIDPLARTSYVVIEGVKKVLTEPASQQPFQKIKACFRQSRIQTEMRQICRQQLESFHRRILLKFQDTFRGVPPLEIYIRLVELSGDADAAEIRNDLFALKGVVALVDEARRFRVIKECYRDAGPEPAIHQICRRRLDGFLNEIMWTRGVELRDISSKAIKRRLLTVATADQVGFMGATNPYLNHCATSAGSRRTEKPEPG